jgi:hypothetical protein
MNSNHEPRELTPGERRTIRKMVTTLCANYCDVYGCLPLDCDCVMLTKRWAGGGCRYFRESVLPNNPVLQASLSRQAARTRDCAVCGVEFPGNGRKMYCSPNCAGKAQRRQQREYLRRARVCDEK